MEITQEEIVDYMNSMGGKMNNKDLVAHFVKYFKDPVSKDKNKSQFKSILNKVSSVVKDESGESFIVLKEKYCVKEEKIVEESKSESTGIIDDATNKENILPSEIEVQVIEPTPSTVEDSETPPNSLPSMDSSTPISVKERANLINKENVDSHAEDGHQPHHHPHHPHPSHVDCDNEHDFTFSTEEKEFILAAAEGDYQKLSEKLSKNPELARYRCPFNGFTALHYACKAGRIDILKLLMQHKANPNQVNYTGSTALHMAVRYRSSANDDKMRENEDMIRMLINNYNASPDLMDYQGWTAKDHLTHWHSQNSRASKTEDLYNLLSERPPAAAAPVTSLIAPLGMLGRRGSHQQPLQEKNLTMMQEMERIVKAAQLVTADHQHVHAAHLKVDRRPSGILSSLTLSRGRNTTSDCAQSQEHCAKSAGKSSSFLHAAPSFLTKGGSSVRSSFRARRTGEEPTLQRPVSAHYPGEHKRGSIPLMRPVSSLLSRTIDEDDDASGGGGGNAPPSISLSLPAGTTVAFPAEERKPEEEDPLPAAQPPAKEAS